MEPKPDRRFWKNWTWSTLAQKLRHDKGALNFAIAIGLIVLSGAGLMVWLNSVTIDYTGDNSVVTKKDPVYYSPLTGLKVKDEAATTRRVTAIMIENSTDARPQSGLKQSGVIFEAVAEGGISRFLVLYQQERPGLVGPVRSLRPYYVEWAAPFDASVAHVGGSYRSLQMIRSGKYGADIDQFFNPAAYWRATDRYAPHNVYTDFAHIDSLNKSKKLTKSSFTGFKRADEAKVEKPNARSIDMGISSGSYSVHYDYNAKANHYARSQGGQPHTDREKGRIAPKVVIAMMVDMKRGFEDGYREQITTSGSGQAFVFQNGTVIKGKWTKKNAKGQIIFTDQAGEEVELVRGQTWITAVPKGKAVTWR